MTKWNKRSEALAKKGDNRVNELVSGLDRGSSNGVSLWLIEIWLRGLVLSSIIALTWPFLRPASAALRYFMRSAVFLGLVAMPVLEIVFPSWPILPLSVLASQERCLAFLCETMQVGPFMFSLADLIGLTWAVIASAFLLQIAIWLSSLRRITFRAFEVDSGPIFEAFELARIRLKLKPKAIKLYVTKSSILPMTWGFWRCSIMVPEETMGWPHAQRLSVFLHELAHVRRRDCLMAALEQVACALHWFNPLSWLAARANRIDREYACDDVVLRSGVKPSDYAQHLLTSATQRLDALPVAAYFNSRKKPLRRRIEAVLKREGVRRRLTFLEACSALVVVSAFAVPVALLEPEEGKSPPETFVEWIPGSRDLAR